MEINAKIIEIFDPVQISDTFRKREMVVEYIENPQYPEYLKFELIQDKCDVLDRFSVNQDVVVHFNLKGRRWTDPQGNVKYFNTLQAWRLVEGSGADDEGAAPAAAASGAPTADDDVTDYGSSDDDIPF